MDFLGGIVQGIILFCLLLLLGYIFFNNPGWVLVGFGVSIFVFIALKELVHKTTKQDSPWE